MKFHENGRMKNPRMVCRAKHWLRCRRSSLLVAGFGAVGLYPRDAGMVRCGPADIGSH
ncbi:protein of unknown function [Azospirillum lipoferum 4B]|uniref:Uncharacterized protein n=1 Tax=Azospirillum lipoferum (strain 4B) TaxID=862719 RepID=G7Z5K5_AZOL4|nr:protein of unknown function [Azospirillum lipoferum 4B]